MRNPFRNAVAEDADRLVDESFAAAGRAIKKAGYTGSVVEIAKQKEGIRIKTCGSVMSGRLKAVAGSFPDMEKIPDIYKELAEIIAGKRRLGSAISSIKRVAGSIRRMQTHYIGKMKYARHTGDARGIRKEFYGRCASLIRKTKKELAFVYEKAPVLRKLPDLEEAITVIITGLPNVGKTSLLTQLTGSRPEIQPYPFTTKGLMLGYAEFEHERIQFIDTPGLLDRPLAKRNQIELQGIATLKLLADIIIYVFDLSETCGFELSKQKRLYDEISGTFRKPVIAVANKTDVVGGRPLEEVGVKGVIPVSCETGEGIGGLVKALREEIEIIKK